MLMQVIKFHKLPNNRLMTLKESFLLSFPSHPWPEPSTDDDDDDNYDRLDKEVIVSTGISPE